MGSGLASHPHREDEKGALVMQTCEPIMVLAEDIEVVDAIIKSRHNGKEKDIFSREMRKTLIAERKAVIHEIFTFWQEKVEENCQNT